MTAKKSAKKIGIAKAWGGVFTESTDAQMEKFSESISFDSRMYAQDIRGSIGHARMLADGRTVLFLLLVVLGNAAGGLFVPCVLKLASRLDRKQDPSTENKK